MIVNTFWFALLVGFLTSAPFLVLAYHKEHPKASKFLAIVWLGLMYGKQTLPITHAQHVQAVQEVSK